MQAVNNYITPGLIYYFNAKLSNDTEQPPQRPDLAS